MIILKWRDSQFPKEEGARGSFLGDRAKERRWNEREARIKHLHIEKFVQGGKEPSMSGGCRGTGGGSVQAGKGSGRVRCAMPSVQTKTKKGKEKAVQGTDTKVK